MTATQFPTLTVDRRGNWEFILPASVLPGDCAKITVSANGIYVEDIDGRYDLITFDDVADCAIPGRLAAIPSNGHGPSPWIYAIEDSFGVISMH